METYISRIQNTVAQLIAARAILDLCLDMEWRQGARLEKGWWEQEGIDLTSIREAAAAGIPEDSEGSDRDKTG